MTVTQSSLLSGRHPSMPSFLARWHRLVARACDPYRPELHYMRGPGPKWHARRQGDTGLMQEP